MKSTIIPFYLRCEYLLNPLGVNVQRFRFSWELKSQERNKSQSAYQILISSTQQEIDAFNGTIWDSGKIKSSQCNQIKYAGPALLEHHYYYWKVRIWDEKDQASDFSETAFYQVGIGDKNNWNANWISYDTKPIDDKKIRKKDANFDRIAKQLEEIMESTNKIEMPDVQEPGELNEKTLRPSPYLRKYFNVKKPIKHAILYSTARGLYEAYINGNRIGTDHFAPGWTDYNKRIQYQTYDVTHYIKHGGNVIGALIADGWYAGYVGEYEERYHYGIRPAFKSQLRIEHTDGSITSIVTDSSWKAMESPIRQAEINHGILYDATMEIKGWCSPDYQDNHWMPVLVLEDTQAELVSQMVPPIRITEEIVPIKINEPKPGVYVMDLGQNIGGWIRMRVSGERGRKIILKYAEILKPNGMVEMTNLTFAKATDTYILKGEGEEIFEPRFTYHGFRYVEITGFPGKPKTTDFTGCIAHSDLQRTGNFWCNDEKINQIYKNTYWGQRANFMSVPTDCPQRAERLGWTGDMFIYAITGAYNMDTAAYYTKWMRDILDAQTSYGAFSDVAPRVVVLINGAPGWGDIGIMLPYVMLKLYEDYRLIDQCYSQMVQWMNYIQEGNPDFLRTKRRGHDYGDWLSYNANTPTDALSTAIWALDVQMMIEIAKALGKSKDQNKFDELFQNIKTAFNREYVQSNGKIKGETQTIYLFALLANLLDDPIKQKSLSHLIQDIKNRNYHLSTGFLGTPYLLPILTETDHLDTAYKILNQEDCPSWKYMVNQGATTIWERWDSDIEMDRILKKSSSPPTYLHHRWGDIKMNNSYNHFALGSVVEWLYRYMAGIDYDPDHSGFKHIRIQPHPGNGITQVHSSYHSLYGIISIEWKIQGTEFHLDLQIPVNTTATVVLPTKNSNSIYETGQPLNAHREIKTIEENKGKIAVKIGSGSYHFAVTDVIA